MYSLLNHILCDKLHVINYFYINFFNLIANNSIPALIRSNYPINKKYGLYYFEITILSVDIE